MHMHVQVGNVYAINQNMYCAPQLGIQRQAVLQMQCN